MLTLLQRAYSTRVKYSKVAKMPDIV